MNLDDYGKKWIDAAVNKKKISVFFMLDKKVILKPPFIEGEIHGLPHVSSTFLAFTALTENFRYGRVFHNDNELILEFKAEVDGKTMHAADIITFNDKGLISSFEVVGRSPDAVRALGDAVKNMPTSLKLRLAIVRTVIKIAMTFRK